MAIINPSQDYDIIHTLTYASSGGDKWGGLNSLVLAREPQEDNIFRRNEEDIRRPMTRNLLDLSVFDESFTGGDE